MYHGLACFSPSSSLPKPATRSPSMVIYVPPAVRFRLLPGTQYPIAALLYRTRMATDTAIAGIRSHLPGRPLSSDVGVRQREMGQPLRVLKLEAERLRVVPLEHGDEQRQCQERV